MQNLSIWRFYAEQYSSHARRMSNEGICFENGFAVRKWFLQQAYRAAAEKHILI